MIALNVL
jgi:hypothetical protein